MSTDKSRKPSSYFLPSAAPIWGRSLLVLGSISLAFGVYLALDSSATAPVSAPDEVAAFFKAIEQPGVPAINLTTLPSWRAARERHAESIKKRALAAEIAATWGVANERAEHIVDHAWNAAGVHHLDPLLVLGVIATESGFQPVGNSIDVARLGKDVDPMKPFGLMQVSGSAHPDKFPDGHVIVTSEKSNIEIGTAVLREYLDMCSGDIAGALQHYNGNSTDKTQRYAHKVLRYKAAFAQALEARLAAATSLAQAT